MDRAKMFLNEITGNDTERKKYLTRIKSRENPHVVVHNQTTKQEPIQEPKQEDTNAPTMASNSGPMLILLPPHLQQVFNSCKVENDAWFKCLGITKTNSEINETKVDECATLLKKLADCQEKAREKLKLL